MFTAGNDGWLNYFSLTRRNKKEIDKAEKTMGLESGKRRGICLCRVLFYLHMRVNNQKQSLQGKATYHSQQHSCNKNLHITR